MANTVSKKTSMLRRTTKATGVALSETAQWVLAGIFTGIIVCLITLIVAYSSGVGFTAMAGTLEKTSEEVCK